MLELFLGYKPIIKKLNLVDKKGLKDEYKKKELNDNRK